MQVVRASHCDCNDLSICIPFATLVLGQGFAGVQACGAGICNLFDSRVGAVSAAG